jgi:uncharacterized repeat protein (TIGR01451 family)
MAINDIDLFSNSQISLKKIGGVVSTNGAEIAAFDAGSDRLFVVAGSVVETQKIDNKGAITADGSLALGFTPTAGTNAIPNSVAVKNGIVAVAYAIQNTTINAQEAGQVSFYRAATGAFLNSVTVGALPDMLTFTPDGTRVLVANEGEPNSYGQANSVDPEGSVSIINIAGGVGAATVQTASFTSFNSQIDALKAAGVRITAPGATVAQDLEPEYIAVSPDGLTARVTLQENNAIAILDIASATITSILPLGVKDHSLPGNGLDASDRDLTASTGTINIRNQPVFGLYQPDAIASFSINGQAYYITANEGDARDYTGFAEESRVGATGYVLDPVKFPNAAALKQNSNLGRLTVTKATGDTDGDGDIDRIEAFGARSFSIWDASGKQVFDSGDQLEQITATQVPTLFNSDGAIASFDTRSDNKGPEPEGVAIGVINNRTYAFIGLERVGDVIVYDVTNPTQPQFIQYLNTPEDIGVEGLSFVAASDSPTGKPLLVTANEVSKTVALFEIAIKPGTSVIDTPIEVQPKITNYDFTNLPKLGTASNGQEISLGGFSGLYFQGLAANGNLKFVTHTDRGPNGEPTGANRPFLLPSFQPEIVSFELNRATSKIDITKRTGLFRADGTTPLTGLPNLQAQANGLAYTDEVGVDLAGKVLPNDPFGADVEGIVVAPNGDYWLVDEYRPAIYRFDTNGKMLDRFIPKGTAAATEPDSAPSSFGTEVLPEVYAQRRSNRGFEAVALDGNKLYAFIQSPIDNPDNAGDSASRASRNLRILEFDTVSKTVTGEYVYLLDSILGTGNAKTDKLGDAVTLGNGKFALVERDDLATNASNKLIYQIDLAGATNINNPANFTLPAGKTIEQLTATELVAAKITPVSKSLIVNAAQLGYTGVEKLEGLALVAPHTLALINDNDFNVAGGNVPSRLGLLELAKDLPVTTDLELTQTLDNNNPSLGDRVTFTLTVANKGIVLANGIKVTDLLPTELSFISATPSQGAYDSITGVWDMGEIAANSSGTLQLTTKVNVNGSVVNRAEITAQKQADRDSTAGNNVATEDDQAATSLSVTALIGATVDSDKLIAGVTPGFDGSRDIVFTGAGKDTVDIAIAGTSAGNNRIDLGSGNDIIYIADADRAFGNTDDDEFEASEVKDYRISGGAGNDTFYLGTNGRALSR